jgi:hypothetical protein
MLMRAGCLGAEIKYARIMGVLRLKIGQSWTVQ